MAEPLLLPDERRASDLSSFAALITQPTGFYNSISPAAVPIIAFGEEIITSRN